MRGGNESDGGRRWKERGGKREEVGGAWVASVDGKWERNEVKD